MNIGSLEGAYGLASSLEGLPLAGGVARRIRRRMQLIGRFVRSPALVAAGDRDFAEEWSARERRTFISAALRSVARVGTRKSVRMVAFLENAAVAVALLAMVVLPLAEIVLRKAGTTGIAGGSTILQHLVLFVGMLGGVVAAREGTLLSLSTAASFLKGGWRKAAAIYSGSFATAISVLLGVAAIQYVQSTRVLGRTFVEEIPLWIVQLILPLGFGLISVRVLWRSAASWRGRALVFLFSGAVLAMGLYPPLPPQQLVPWALAGLLLATGLGTPIFTTLGGAALILFWGQESPIASIAIDHYRMVVNPSLAAIPLFTLAGYFLAEGGASKRLIHVFSALVGRFRGGPAIVTAMVCAFFTSFTGASGVTILALGGLLLPVLLSAGYARNSAIGLLTASGSIGLLLPPCLPLMLYAIVASNAGGMVTIKDMFLGGIGPGLFLVGLTAWWGIRCQPKGTFTRREFDSREAVRAVWAAKWELLLPVVALVALFGGFATPVEAAAVTALYAFVVETFVYRDLGLRRDLVRVSKECGRLVGGVLLILGVAMGFNNFLIDAQIPDLAVDWVRETIHSPYLFLLALNGFLLLVGCLMDIFSAIIVVVPLIVPMGLAFGMDPVHLGIIFLANLELGYLTPPVGMNLFLSAYRFGRPLPEIYRSVLPMLLVLLAGVLLITYVPALTTALPGWFK